MIDGVVGRGDLLQGLTLVTFWPPEGLFDGPRKLLVRAARGGFLSPSLDGGLPPPEKPPSDEPPPISG
jgi:hypothetical protein